MKHKPIRDLNLLDAASSHPRREFRDLLFYVKLYLHLSNGGVVDTLPSDMPCPDAGCVRLCKGVRLAVRPAQPRVALGGHLLYGNVPLAPSNLAMVAVKARRSATAANPNPGFEIWYGQLVLSFTIQYTQRTLSLCLVRWLDRAARVSARIVAAASSFQRSAVQAAERVRMERGAV